MITGHRFDMHSRVCPRCHRPSFEWTQIGVKCGASNRRARKRMVRWWRDFAKRLWLKPEEIRYEERARLSGHTFISEYMEISSKRRGDFLAQQQ